MTWTITPLSTALEFNTSNAEPGRVIQLDATHYAVAYKNGGGGVTIEVLALNAGTGALTEVSAASTTVVGAGTSPGCDFILIDSTHFLVVFATDVTDGFAIVFSVNLTTWALAEVGTALEFDTSNGNHCHTEQIDSSHALVVYQSTSGDGFAVVLTWDGSYVVTTAAAAFEFDSADYSYGSIPLKVNDDNTKYILFYQGVDADGFVKILSVNNTTWVVSTQTSAEFDTDSGQRNFAVRLDATHFLNLWVGGAGATGKAQVFAVDTGDWSADAQGSPLEYYAGGAALWPAGCILDDDGTAYYVAVTYGDVDSDGKITVLKVSKSTWAVTEDATPVEFDTLQGLYNVICKVNDTRVVNAWQGDANDGFAKAFDITGGLAASGNPWYFYRQQNAA